MPDAGSPEFSIVIPVLDEEETLEELFRRLGPVIDELDGSSEVILVDDGSTDRSFPIMIDLHRRDPRFKAVRLSRNFGHQIALTAGLDHATGQAVILMDADLQDPPELIMELVEQWRAGCQVVYAVRSRREGDSRLKRSTAKWFYRILGAMSDVDLPEEAGDFRLLDRSVVDALSEMPEHGRYLRGMSAWVGFEQTAVRYERDPRFAGETKYPLRRMLRFAGDGIVSFSARPLRLVLQVGLVVSGLSMLSAAAIVATKLAGSSSFLPGWASIAVVATFLGGLQLTVLGVMATYIARIYEEVQNRPLYLTSAFVGSESADRPTSAERSRRSDAVRERHDG